MNTRRLLLSGALIFFSISAQAELYLYNNLKCVSTVERREIHIYKNSTEAPDGPVCRVDYLKQGNTNTLWTAQSNADFCIEKANELAATLESASFKCVSTDTFEEN